jgi:hypothetical protein
MSTGINYNLDTGLYEVRCKDPLPVEQGYLFCYHAAKNRDMAERIAREHDGVVRAAIDYEACQRVHKFWSLLSGKTQQPILTMDVMRAVVRATFKGLWRQLRVAVVKALARSLPLREQDYNANTMAIIYLIAEDVKSHTEPMTPEDREVQSLIIQACKQNARLRYYFAAELSINANRSDRMAPNNICYNIAMALWGVKAEGKSRKACMYYDNEEYINMYQHINQDDALEATWLQWRDGTTAS